MFAVCAFFLQIFRLEFDSAMTVLCVRCCNSLVFFCPLAFLRVESILSTDAERLVCSGYMPIFSFISVVMSLCANRQRSVCLNALRSPVRFFLDSFPLLHFISFIFIFAIYFFCCFAFLLHFFASFYLIQCIRVCVCVFSASAKFYKSRVMATKLFLSHPRY